MTVTPADLALVAAPVGRKRGVLAYIRRHPTIVIGATLLTLMALMAVFAPYLGTVDPQALSPIRRLRKPSEMYWFGTDMLGRDVYSRVVYGSRVSLLVGIAVAAVSAFVGLVIGLVTGFNRIADALVMRIMDGLMSIPAVLIAIALMALTRASLENVVFAIAVAEIPRVTRVVRGVVLTLREQPFVEAAVATGTSFVTILYRHILPNTIAPLIVQATYICASAILIEAALSFLGAGTPPEIPTWGNMIAQSRLFLSRAPWTIFCPGIALALVVLAVNLLGDGLRDRLDPRLARRM
jgi:peptide/nickel transport system permease protein